ncbi:MAG TPA: SDR family oxidoreductase [Candidatus Dormibacteraeota bacterium]|jgi:NAD(P)-dependent dehydrogenase (short-subunit alcohol dehydrogenase family)|nr:SDR family oxidoreductase [Candidatus Dormibacteraeota bacterium]
MEIRGVMAVVTGAAAGTGRAIAIRLAAEGARVAVADVDERQSAVTVQLIRDAGGDAAAVAGDVTSHASVVAMLAGAEAALDGLGILVNNAGGAERPPFPEAPVEALDLCLDLNLRGPLYAIREALPLMARRGGGAIINISSIGGTRGGPDNFPAYNAAKAGLIRLSETLRPTCDRLGVTIGCLTPDLILTERVRAEMGLGPGERPVSVPDAVEPEVVAAEVAAMIGG